MIIGCPWRPIVSQCSSLRIGVTWSYFLPPATNLVATFCTHWTSLSRYFLIALKSLSWMKAVLHQIFGTRVHHTKKNWTQSDLSFCKNEWSIFFNLMEKRVNWIENEGKIDTNAWNLLNNTFGWKITPTLGPSISGTKCDRDKMW